jgi:hypothetical protein
MRALDATLSVSDLAEARRDMEDAAFHRERHGEARNELTNLDDEDAEEVDKKRDQIRDRIRSQ